MVELTTRDARNESRIGRVTLHFVVWRGTESTIAWKERVAAPTNIGIAVRTPALLHRAAAAADKIVVVVRALVPRAPLDTDTRNSTLHKRALGRSHVAERSLNIDA